MYVDIEQWYVGLEKNNSAAALSPGDLKLLEHNCHYLTARNRMPYEEMTT